jgi:RNA polymerase sigma-70 factor, ECF subfamily
LRDDLTRCTDEELVRLVLAGDGTAARVLFERHEQVLRSRARRRLVGGLRRKVGASDIVQETYLSVFTDLTGFEDRGPGSFRRWLDTVLECRAKDEARRHVGAAKRSARREVSRPADVSDPGPRAWGDSPSVAAVKQEDREMLLRAITSMEGDDRRVLELVHLEGKGFADAGRALGRSTGAARKLYARAVLRLGKRIRSGS